MSDPAPTRLGESLRGLADSGLATLQTRLELFAVELKEEKLRAGGFLFDTVLAALFIGFGMVFRVNANTGGLDVVGAVVKKYYAIDMGTVIFVLNFLIVAGSAFVCTFRQRGRYSNSFCQSCQA